MTLYKRHMPTGFKPTNVKQYVHCVKKYSLFQTSRGVLNRFQVPRQRSSLSPKSPNRNGKVASQPRLDNVTNSHHADNVSTSSIKVKSRNGLFTGKVSPVNSKGRFYILINKIAKLSLPIWSRRKDRECKIEE